MASLAPLYDDLPMALLIAWGIALLIAGGVLGLAAALDDWMNGVPPSGKRKPSLYPDADWRIVGGAGRRTTYAVAQVQNWSPT